MSNKKRDISKFIKPYRKVEFPHFEPRNNTLYKKWQGFCLVANNVIFGDTNRLCMNFRPEPPYILPHESYDVKVNKIVYIVEFTIGNHKDKFSIRERPKSKLCIEYLESQNDEEDDEEDNEEEYINIYFCMNTSLDDSESEIFDLNNYDFYWSEKQNIVHGFCRNNTSDEDHIMFGLFSMFLLFPLAPLTSDGAKILQAFFDEAYFSEFVDGYLRVVYSPKTSFYLDELKMLGTHEVYYYFTKDKSKKKDQLIIKNPFYPDLRYWYQNRCDEHVENTEVLTKFLNMFYYSPTRDIPPSGDISGSKIGDFVYRDFKPRRQAELLRLKRTQTARKESSSEEEADSSDDSSEEEADSSDDSELETTQQSQRSSSSVAEPLRHSLRNISGAEKSTYKESASTSESDDSGEDRDMPHLDLDTSSSVQHPPESPTSSSQSFSSQAQGPLMRGFGIGMHSSEPPASSAKARIRRRVRENESDDDELGRLSHASSPANVSPFGFGRLSHASSPARVSPFGLSPLANHLHSLSMVSPAGSKRSSVVANSPAGSGRSYVVSPSGSSHSSMSLLSDSSSSSKRRKSSELRPPPIRKESITRQLDDKKHKGDVFEVERICGKYTTPSRRVLYRLRWKGYPPGHDSWREAHEISNMENDIENFNREHTEPSFNYEDRPPRDIS